jgi:hypothetical protein
MNFTLLSSFVLYIFVLVVKQAQDTSSWHCTWLSTGITLPFSFISHCFNAQTSQPYKSDGRAKILFTYNQDCLWTKYYFETLFRIPNICRSYLFLKLCPFPLHIKFYIPKIWMYLLVPMWYYLLQVYFWLESVQHHCHIMLI